MADLTLYGYRFSVYTRVVRMVLREKNLHAAYKEANPFASPPDSALFDVNPFGRVPVLQHGDFTLFETAAILDYLEAQTPDPQMLPEAPEAVARMRQIIGIVDHAAYPVFVRQVYSHAVFRPFMEVESDPAVIKAGLAAAVPILCVLEKIAREGLLLTTARLSLADFHLAPMIAAFSQAHEGRAMLAKHATLNAWFENISSRESFIATDPGVHLH